MQVSNSWLIRVLSTYTGIMVITIIVLDYGILWIPFKDLFSGYLKEKDADNAEGLIQGIMIVGSCWVLIKLLGLNILAGLRLWRVENPILLLIPFLYPMTLLAGNLFPLHPNISIASTGLALLSCIALGLSEEVAFRGLIQSYLISKYGDRISLFKIVCINSLLFALMHLMNLRHLIWLSVFNQVVVAFFFGVFFSGLLFRTRNIFFLGIIHGLVNFISNFQAYTNPDYVMPKEYVDSLGEALFSSGVYILLFSGLFFIGYFLIKGQRVDELAGVRLSGGISLGKD